MKTFQVSVEKRMYATGIVEIEAENADEATKKVLDKIVEGEINTSDIEWSEPEYEEMSFDITGDVDEK